MFHVWPVAHLLKDFRRSLDPLWPSARLIVGMGYHHPPLCLWDHTSVSDVGGPGHKPIGYAQLWGGTSV